VWSRADVPTWETDLLTGLDHEPLSQAKGVLFST
jgi:hypothetical protein